MTNLSLKKSNNFQNQKKPLLLIIMDGVGIGKQDASNAFYMAKTPNLDKLFKENLYTEIQAHGKAVGLPSDDDMGNSEVGHNALGAGRVFSQGAKLVQEAIASGALYEGDTWQALTDNCLENNSKLHFIGLLSDGNVHSNINHLIDMLNKASQKGVKEACVHVLLDGRDVGEKSAHSYLEKLESTLATINQAPNKNYCIASGGGRMITTMDRYNADWTIVKRGWDAHVLGTARQFESASQAVQTFYDEDHKITDQYLPSFTIAKDGNPVGTIEDNDSVIFFNFRGDRSIEISMAFELEEFNYFDRLRKPNVKYAGMMEYDGDMHIPSTYLVTPPKIDRTLSQYLCSQRVTSFAISETQKFGHVTYFWNGNKSGYIDESLEKYEEIESDKIPFDQAPKMKAYEITEKTIACLKSGKYQFGRINIANGDMVGHTGVIDAAIIAMEAVDECVGKLAKVVAELGGVTLITADHGNSDIMFTTKNDKKTPFTAHTLNPVPFVICGANCQLAEIAKPGLANVAATVCNLLGYEAPGDYEPSLIT
jgi:2,3-bisphosphoglycerate-independent phosphoglycerate mutase